MNASVRGDTEVLIVGAGPTGLVLALWLTRLGVRVRIVDKTTEPGTTSRALALQARTLELYRQIGLADAVIEAGRRIEAVNLWVAGKQAAHAVFGNMGTGLSPFPYALIYPQDEHELLLVDRLAEAGIEVERRTELLGFEDTDARVLAHLRGPDGVREAYGAAYIAGCANMSFVFHREDGEEIRRVEANMHFAVYRRTPCLHIGDIEEVRVSPARESDLQCRRMPNTNTTISRGLT